MILHRYISKIWIAPACLSARPQPPRFSRPQLSSGPRAPDDRRLLRRRGPPLLRRVLLPRALGRRRRPRRPLSGPHSFAMPAMRPEPAHVLPGSDRARRACGIPRPWLRLRRPVARDGPHTFAMPVMRPELFHVLPGSDRALGFDIPRPWIRLRRPVARDGPHTSAMPVMRPELVRVLPGFDRARRVRHTAVERPFFGARSEGRSRAPPRRAAEGGGDLESRKLVHSTLKTGGSRPTGASLRCR